MISRFIISNHPYKILSYSILQTTNLSTFPIKSLFQNHRILNIFVSFLRKILQHLKCACNQSECEVAEGHQRIARYSSRASFSERVCASIRLKFQCIFNFPRSINPLRLISFKKLQSICTSSADILVTSVKHSQFAYPYPIGIRDRARPFCTLAWLSRLAARAHPIRKKKIAHTSANASSFLCEIQARFSCRVLLIFRGDGIHDFKSPFCRERDQEGEGVK